jgi:c-di-GMP-specific phosphodiesterase
MTVRGSSAEELRLLSLAINETDRAVLVLDEDRRIVYLNRAFTVLFGYSADEVRGRRPTEFLAGPATDLVSLRRAREKAWSDKAFLEEIVFYRKDGQEIWVSANTNHVIDAGGQVTNLIVVLADITEAKQIQGLQRSVLESVANGLSLAEIGDLLCRTVEKIAPELLCSIVLVDSSGKLKSLAAPSLSTRYSESIDEVPIGPDAGSCGTAAFTGAEVCAVDIETDPRWANYKKLALESGLRACWSSPIKIRDGSVVGAFAFYYREPREPSPLHKELVSVCLHLCSLAIEREEAKRQIERLSRFDTLTGLPNRKSVYEIANDLLRSTSPAPIAFLAVDIDRFKHINSAFGGQTGELILIETALRLQKIVSSHGIVGRIGGDSFAVISKESDNTRVSLLAERILLTLQEPIQLPGNVLSISVSIGITISDEVDVSADALIEQAVSAMHEAKMAGTGLYHFYRPEMNSFAQERLRIGAALRNAISSNSFQLYYQPQIHLSHTRLIGVEALLRWKDEALGDILPEQFIPLAEETGLVEAIGCWSLREACRQMAEWVQKGVSVPSISVNLSPTQFRDQDLFDFISRLLSEFDIAPGCLTIEITENVTMGSDTAVLDVLARLHRIGVGLSIDDFGTGFSSLSRLIRLPITELKLDRSFMRDLETDVAAQAVATAVIRIGQSLNMTVIAEGVETERQAQLLASFGCDAAQGYLYGKPMRARELENRIARGFSRPSATHA